MIFFQAMAETSERRNALFLGVALLVVTVIIFREAASVMVDAWRQEEYSHGYLVPFVALLMLCNKMNDERIVPQASWFGFGLVAACVIAQFFLQVAGVKGLQPQIFLLALIGVFVLFYGLKASLTVAGPLLIVLFAAPLPKFFYYTMSFNMQMLSTSLGTAVLRFLGIAVLQDGNVIDLGSYQLQVVEACNGLRYLFPLMCLGFMLAVMLKTSLLKRVFLFASTLPIAIIMNSLRIALIGVTVDRWGKEMAEGVLHDFEGWVVFMGCALILMIEIQIMQRIGSKGEFDFESIRLPSLKILPLPGTGTPSLAALGFAGFALAASLVTPFFFPHHIQPVPLAKPLAQFPMQLGEWTGRMGKLDDKILEVLGTRDYLIADFAAAGKPPVNLYVLYYPQQDSTSNQAVHSPSVCIPAGGWTVVSTAVETITIDSGNKLDVNKMVISKDAIRQIIYYWFVQDGFSAADANISKLHLLQSALFKGRANGAMIRMTTVMKGNDPEQIPDHVLSKFLQNALPALNAHLFSPVTRQ